MRHVSRPFSVGWRGRAKLTSVTKYVIPYSRVMWFKMQDSQRPTTLNVWRYHCHASTQDFAWRLFPPRFVIGCFTSQRKTNFIRKGMNFSSLQKATSCLGEARTPIQLRDACKHFNNELNAHTVFVGAVLSLLTPLSQIDSRTECAMRIICRISPDAH